MNCHTELPKELNVFGMTRRQCPVCGGWYYEKLEDAVSLDAFNQRGL